jgi:hypothetical protein
MLNPNTTVAKKLFDTNTYKDVNEGIVPSVSETDCGHLGFQNSEWRQNQSWRNVFENSSFMPHITATSRRLFGNVQYAGVDGSPTYAIDKLLTMKWSL